MAITPISEYIHTPLPQPIEQSLTSKVCCCFLSCQPVATHPFTPSLPKITHLKDITAQEFKQIASFQNNTAKKMLPSVTEEP